VFVFVLFLCLGVVVSEPGERVRVNG